VKFRILAGIALLSLLTFVQPLSAQALSTATVVAADSYRSASGTGTNYLLDTGTDAAGNLYVLGHANNDFVNMTGVTTSVFNFNYSQTDNIYLAKYSSAGSLLWIRDIDNTMNEAGYAMDVSNSGRVAIAGRICAPLNIAPSISISPISQTCDGFLAVLDADGQGLWGKSFGDPNSSYPNQWVTNVTFDAAGNIYLAAFFESMDFISAYGIGGITFTNPSGVDYQGAVIVKTNASGTVSWVKPLRKGVYVANKGLKATSDGVYAAGYFNFATTFDALGSYTPTGNDGFVAKIASSNQQFSNLKIMGGTGDQTINGIAVNSAGALIIGARVAGTGVLNGVNYVSAGLSDHVVFKMSGSGWVTDWARQISSVGNDFYQGLAVDADDRVYVAGSFTGTLNLGSVGTFTSGNTGSSNGVVLGLEPDGQLAWAKQTTSVSTGYSSLNAGVSVFGNTVYAGGQSAGNQTTVDGVTITGNAYNCCNAYGSGYWVKITTSPLGGSVQVNSVVPVAPIANAIDVTGVSTRVLNADQTNTTVLLTGKNLDQVTGAEILGKKISFEFLKNGQLQLTVPSVGITWQNLQLTGAAFKYVLQSAFRDGQLKTIEVKNLASTQSVVGTRIKIAQASETIIGKSSVTCQVTLAAKLPKKFVDAQIASARNYCNRLALQSRFEIIRNASATSLRVLVRG
jgi:hypothetical protein